MKKVELLAPAGDYASFEGAIHAGADAVYLAGGKFGARAYARNLTEEEIIRAIRYAHLFGRKVYLAVNTLMKEVELKQLCGYLLPFYENGLDAVIVQDLGAAALICRCFPDLPLHISTQMTVTGAFGAELLKGLGASRVVPARELSLAEIRALKKRACLEVEVFVHGALCYCYSGQCLFSSVLGGRSGNRGRCAQPCRLPYGQEDSYPLSLKDLCALGRVPELIEAGVDSFKIEGRMKKPEYAAGVTAVYRKYIDRYYESPKQPFHVNKEDMDYLQKLYVRSGLQDGYLDRHNGREMITLKQPGYAGSSEALLEDIRKEHLSGPLTLGIIGQVSLKKGEPAALTVYTKKKEACVTALGEVVQEARKQPLNKDSVLKQLTKTGGTPFVFDRLELAMEEDIFLPVKSLNELRRDALELLQEKLAGPLRKTDAAAAPAAKGWEGGRDRRGRLPEGMPELFVSVHTMDQLEAILALGDCVAGIYVPAELCLARDVLGRIREAKKKVPSLRLYLAMPYILRDCSYHLTAHAAEGAGKKSIRKEEEFLREMELLIKDEAADGILARNLETLKWFRGIGSGKLVVTDSNLYVWNEEAAECLARLSCPDGQPPSHVRLTLPAEGNRGMLRDLSGSGRELIVYGRTALMITANCVRRTSGRCLLQDKSARFGAAQEYDSLKDRLQKIFPVETNCSYCYNVIYNSVPTSLHQEMGQVAAWGLEGLRLQFTVESGLQCAQITQYFAGLPAGPDMPAPPFGEYTRGHFKQGVL